MRGLAALPLQPVMDNTGPLQLVWLDDLVQTIVFFLHPQAPSHEIVDVVGPATWNFPDIVRLLRHWMRWPESRTFTVPGFISTLLYKLGDAVGTLAGDPRYGKLHVGRLCMERRGTQAGGRSLLELHPPTLR
jgi:hypothetical protein